MEAEHFRVIQAALFTLVASASAGPVAAVRGEQLVGCRANRRYLRREISYDSLACCLVNSGVVARYACLVCIACVSIFGGVCICVSCTCVCMSMCVCVRMFMRSVCVCGCGCVCTCFCRARYNTYLVSSIRLSCLLRLSTWGLIQSLGAASKSLGATNSSVDASPPFVLPLCLVDLTFLLTPSNPPGYTIPRPYLFCIFATSLCYVFLRRLSLFLRRKKKNACTVARMHAHTAPRTPARR